jgi:hypothetical protein
MTDKKAGRIISMGPTKPEPKQKEVSIEVIEETIEVPLLEGQYIMYVLDPSAIKTIEDVAIILDGLHIGLLPDNFNSLDGRVQQLFRRAVVETIPKSNN